MIRDHLAELDADLRSEYHVGFYPLVRELGGDAVHLLGLIQQLPAGSRVHALDAEPDDVEATLSRAEWLAARAGDLTAMLRHDLAVMFHDEAAGPLPEPPDLVLTPADDGDARAADADTDAAGKLDAMLSFF